MSEVPRSSGRAACLLIGLGILLAPAHHVAATALPEAAAQRAANLATRERIAALEAMLAGDPCLDAGEARALLGLREPAAAAVSAALGAPGAPPPAAAEMGKVAPVSRAQLVETLQKAVVLVIAGSDTGSGFFVTPRIVVTNDHVVENATDPEIVIVGRGTGGPRLAKVIARAAGEEVNARDYAVLEVEGPPSSVTLPLTAVVGELDGVVAAGFPGLLLDNDLNFQALVGGDMGALPDLALSQGAVMARQNRDRGLTTLAHSAAISGGNSGGPLVDACGRVVGINTFINVSVEQASSAAFALGAADLMSYLRELGIPFDRSDTPCE